MAGYFLFACEPEVQDDAIEIPLLWSVLLEVVLSEMFAKE